ncbi:MAG: putative DNA binding domain-containing protein [Elusimicrobia bacterium]|nr:putative DNA binding domain-containing protein [Elusimicrobiota bacterium]MBU2615039.1 putative DNA binding domain-containing protein [Elusimicrobiota bacterium]
MNKQELIKKLQDIEWEDFEVKEAKSDLPKNIWETVSAFSNTAGGWLILGVSKSGNTYDIMGIDNPVKIESDFLTALRGDKFNKKIPVKCKKYRINNKTIFGFYIPSVSAKDKPVYFNAVTNAFIRTGSGDQRATREEIDALYRNSSFEEKDQERTKYTIKDLDKKSIDGYRQYFKTVNEGHHFNELSDAAFLNSLRVTIKDRVTYGGLLLFGKDLPLAHTFSNYHIDYLEIPGISYEDGPTRYTYRLTSEQNIYRSFFDIYDRLSKRVDVPFKLVGPFGDNNPPQLQAIREALVNMLIHSDYYSAIVPRVRVFSDRIEFFNPGTLPKSIEDILKEGFSQPRNPIVAKAFRYIRLADTIGSGFYKMFNGWQSYYKNKPEITGDIDYYRIMFKFGAKSSGAPINVPENVPINVPEKRNDIILLQIAKNNKITIPQLSKLLKVNDKTIKRDIENLKNKGLLKRVGARKGGNWEVIKDEKRQ